MQVFGGMGFVEETGVAQFYRDVRVTAIYEGTNGIQAMDMVGRKLMDGGAAARALIAEARGTAGAAGGELGTRLEAGADALTAATGWMLAAETNDRFAGAAPYLRAFALLLGGHYLLKGATVSGDARRLALAGFHVRSRMAEVPALCDQAQGGAAQLYAYDLAS
jgi:hypothetical protein